MLNSKTCSALVLVLTRTQSAGDYKQSQNYHAKANAKLLALESQQEG